MGKLIAELKRRHIYRVAAAYAVVAWVLLQIVNNIAPAFNLPGTAVMLVILLLSMGFPIALIFAWVLELRSPNAPTQTGTMDWALVAVAITFVGMFTYQQFAPSRATVTAQSGIEAARDAATKPAGISVAVLPFVNLSSDAEQEFFSDGMTEEITTALAKVPDLRVVARTSAFQFKGENRDVQNIGQQLHATHVIEGSVRKAGERVRITVQLIDSANGTHVWSENYDRQLTDIFAIQEDIARTITTSLRMPLGLKPGENLVNNRNIDPESYQQYLRAKALVLQRAAGARNAIKILEPLVARYPNYAPAWVQLARAYPAEALLFRFAAPDELKRAQATARTKTDSAVHHAVALDPNMADGYRLLGGLAMQNGHLVEGEELSSRALALDPENAETLNTSAALLAMVGRLSESLAMRRQLQGLEPFVPVYNGNLAEVLWLLGQNDEAIAINSSFKGTGAERDLAEMYAALGRYGEAAATLSQIATPDTAEIVGEAVRLLRAAPKKTPSRKDLRLSAFGFAYLHVGAPERALEFYELNADAGAPGVASVALLWHPTYAPVRKLERFKAYVRKVGLVDYWRAKGWPEFCHPTTGDDFECNRNVFGMIRYPTASYAESCDIFGPALETSLNGRFIFLHAPTASGIRERA